MGGLNVYIGVNAEKTTPGIKAGFSYPVMRQTSWNTPNLRNVCFSTNHHHFAEPFINHSVSLRLEQIMQN
jgi:hypothetical protein